VIHNGLPVRQIQNAARPPDSLLERLQSGPLIMYAGRLVSDKYSEKNVAGLIKAVKIANRTVPCDALIAGSGPQRPALEALAVELGIESNVVFSGHLTPTDLWATMKRASVFALVSPYEGMPNAVMEAVVCGCPVVLSDIPAHRELLSDDMAMFVNHQDPTSIAKGLLACLIDPAAARERATRALAVVEQWSVAQMARSYEHLYQDVLSTGSMRGD